ncbi:Casein kinase 1-like protein 2 (Protein CASEIN KINASE I-LIKE 2) [Durusdinium trenchii]|uniref:Casein kinase I n=1 Tax=Durusdinium trenchii TaxID=1381693 RepID=A0ABP0IC77_9DINO
MGSVRPELDFDDVLPDESSEAGSTLRGSNVHFHVSGSECTTRSGLYAKQTSSTTELPTPLKDTKLEALEAASDGRPPVPKSVGRFQILRKLGSGSYSVVHLAFDKEENQLVAVKFEWQNAEKTDKLLKEAALLEVFGSRSPRTTSMIWTGTKGEYDIMAMNLLGPSLEDVFMKKCRRKFSLKTVLMIGEQMIDCMEFVHSHKILHRDIKPSNFVLGPKGQQEKIYVVDFGLAKSFRDGRGRHIPCVKKSGMTGTARYTTVNLHRGYEPSRRDDLGSIGYVLLYFLRGQLPWQGINHRDKKKRKKRIGKKKTATMHEDLCAGFPNEFVEYFRYCDRLRFEDKPDYAYLRSLMHKAAARHKIDFDGQFDWVLRTKRTPAPENDAFRADDACRARVTERGPWEISSDYAPQYSTYESTYYESYEVGGGQ